MNKKCPNLFQALTVQVRIQIDKLLLIPNMINLNITKNIEHLCQNYSG